MKYTLKNIGIIVGLILTFTNLSAQNDSINKVDDQNRKQGHWIFKNNLKNLPGYTSNQIVEEGFFINNKKEGKWTFYFNNGKPKHVLNYKDGTADGKATFYYKNGNIRESGTWSNNRWVGEYAMYYRNGQPKNKFNYNLQGLKDGKQIYYHENGKPSLIGTWNNGEETSDIAEYLEDGTANTERFDAGPKIKDTIEIIFEEAKIELAEIILDSAEFSLDSTEIILDSVEFILDSAEFVIDSVDSNFNKLKIITFTKPKTPVAPFDGNGFHVFKDRNGKKSKVGEFEDGLLINGKIFKYGEDGKLILTKIVRNGDVVKVVRE